MRAARRAGHAPARGSPSRCRHAAGRGGRTPSPAPAGRGGHLGPLPAGSVTNEPKRGGLARSLQLGAPLPKARPPARSRGGGVLPQQLGAPPAGQRTRAARRVPASLPVCDPGLYFDSTRGKCVGCPSGSFSLGGLYGSAACITCPGNFVTDPSNLYPSKCDCERAHAPA